jgi:hypothetical protein
MSGGGIRHKRNVTAEVSVYCPDSGLGHSCYGVAATTIKQWGRIWKRFNCSFSSSLVIISSASFTSDIGLSWSSLIRVGGSLYTARLAAVRAEGHPEKNKHQRRYEVMLVFSTVGPRLKDGYGQCLLIVVVISHQYSKTAVFCVQRMLYVCVWELARSVHNLWQEIDKCVSLR